MLGPLTLQAGKRGVGGKWGRDFLVNNKFTEQCSLGGLFSYPWTSVVLDGFRCGQKERYSCGSLGFNSLLCLRVSEIAAPMSQESILAASQA